MNKKTLFAAIILGIFSVSIYSQMSPEVVHKKIDTKYYEIIFPKSYEKNAGKIAALMDQYFLRETDYLGINKIDKISVILNNKTAYSNGFVTLAPRFSMFYTLAPQYNTYTLFYDDWIRGLVVHEMRHAAQFQKMNYGYNRLLYTLFGESGLAIGMGLSVPGWFMEGDAIYMETELTNYGRGRTPSFSILTKSILLSETIPSYAQNYLGSNFSVYPNYYETGYLLTTYLRKKYGKTIFAKILKFSATWDFLVGPYSFALGVYQVTGTSLYETYENMMLESRAYWEKQSKEIKLTNYESLKLPKRVYYTSYSNPVSSTTGETVYAYKKGKFHAPSVVALQPDGKEKILFFTDTLTGSIGVSGDYIFWSEEEPDVRWDDSESIVKSYNLKNRELKRYKFNGRIFSPSISSDCTRLAAIENDINGDIFLVIIDVSSGTILDKVQAPENVLWQTPRWGNTDDKIAIVESTESGKSIIIYKPTDRRVFRFMKPEKYQISDPFIQENFILFHSDLEGTDNIYAIKIDSPGMKRVTSVALGAFQPSVSKNGKFIYFGNFTRMGMEVARMDYNSANWSEIRQDHQENFVSSASPFYQPEPINESNGASAAAAGKSKDYNIENYPDFLNFLNFHSRYIDPTSFLGLGQISASLVSSNKLQTHFLSLLYTYHSFENDHSIRGEWMFRGWFPVIKLGGYFGSRNENDFELNIFDSYKTWYDKEAYAQIFLPLKVSQGAVSHQIEPGIEITYANISNYSIDGIASAYDNYSGLRNQFNIVYNFYLKGNPRLFDHPYFKFDLLLDYAPQIAIFNENRDYSEGSVAIEVPGFFNDNRIIVKGGASIRTDPFDHIFKSKISYPRGKSLDIYQSLYMVSLDYIFPLFYPDLDILHIIYIKQITMDLFYEHIWLQPYVLSNPEYIGGDIYIHFNIFELKYDLLGGLRFIYYPVEQSFTTEPIINLQINYNF